ncbi:hypothetical protein AX14_001037 [Amanita brunnescens Koide BX004]|nr:hypothetical protein AX14_001037 [Amanita brunnescens Koide BX004]
MVDHRQVKEVVVLGAGVIGLTTAIKIQETSGYKVTIVAEIFPTDTKNVRYASHFAGAQFVASASCHDLRQRRIEKDSYETFWELSAPGSPTEQYFLRLQQTEFYATIDPAYFEDFRGYRALEKDELLSGTDKGLTFESFTIDAPRYMNYLLSRFLGSGGTIVRGTVQHISQLVEGGASIFQYGLGARPQPPHAIVVCTGLGARNLGGLEDKNLIPVKGQTVLIRAPWVQFGKSASDGRGMWTYVIPRRSGNVILGGVKHANSWDTKPTVEITRDILERTLNMCPEIAPPGVRKEREPTVDDIIPLIVEENVGFRPTNLVSNFRLEVELCEGTGRQPEIPIVYNYGHGGYGFIMSWGSASIVLELLEDALTKV